MTIQDVLIAVRDAVVVIHYHYSLFAMTKSLPFTILGLPFENCRKAPKDYAELAYCRRRLRLNTG